MFSFFFWDEILPSKNGDYFISHYKDPYKSTSITASLRWFSFPEVVRVSWSLPGREEAAAAAKMSKAQWDGLQAAGLGGGGGGGGGAGLGGGGGGDKNDDNDDNDKNDNDRNGGSDNDD